MSALTKQQAQHLYREFSKASLNPQIQKALKDWKDLHLVSKVAKNSSEEEFVTFVIEHEVPALKLTPKEMEAIKGGGLIKDIVNAYNSIKNILKGPQY